ncbi:MAG: ATP-binding cassette domain-containing protein [Planctomycetaceae bacterium]|jgi:ABC-type dipeptide/oligopeptide/nickel transport system ATPase component|nr:ATP-binding cassette domain-containing protein [Planctomycetaceae bacterium]
MNESEINIFVNPFSTKFWTPGTIPYLFDEQEELNINTLIGQKLEQGLVMQIVGSHGSGKSTLLRTIMRSLEQQYFTIRLEVLNDCQCKLSPDFLPVRHDKSVVYMIDGYEQLSVWERFRLRFQDWSLTGGLLLTTHKPVLGIRVLHKTTPRFELFVKLVQELTKTYSATDSDSFSFGITELREIYQRADNNFRTAFFELYDIIQEKESPNRAREKKRRRDNVPESII